MMLSLPARYLKPGSSLSSPCNPTWHLCQHITNDAWTGLRRPGHGLQPRYAGGYPRSFQAASARPRRYVAALRANKRHGGCRGTREVGSHRGQGA
jgi:hypothetical protein